MSARDLINRRVVTFVEELKITGKVVQVLKSKENGFWCELNTDIRITTKLRILELPIRNRRKSNPENSFWVSAIQCMPEDGNYFPNNTSANEHAQQNKQHTIQTSKSAKFKLGDKIYAITDETNESNKYKSIGNVTHPHSEQHYHDITMASTDNNNDVILGTTLEDLKQNIDAIKNNMTVKTEALKKKLDATKAELFVKLEEILKQTENKFMSQKEEMLQQLKRGKEESSKTFKHNQVKHLLDKIIGEIDQEIAKVETSFNIDIPVLSVYWGEQNVNSAIAVLCDLRVSYGKYKHKNCHKWVMSDISADKGLGGAPRGLRIDQHNGNVYVLDNSNNRIQVYSIAGVYIKTITDTALKYPSYLCLDAAHIFVSCYYKDTNNVFKFNKGTGKLDAQNMIDAELTGITEHNGEIFVCQANNKKLSVLNDKLVVQKTVSLKSPHFQNNAHIRDMQTYNNLLYVLAINSNYSIQAFNRQTGELVSALISRNIVQNSCYHFCIDSNANIIISLQSYHQIKIFDIDGNLLQIYGRQGNESNELFNPYGIDVYNGLLVVCQHSNIRMKAI